MAITIPSSSTFSPTVMSLIPLFYIGWADNLLSPSEIKTIHQGLSKFPNLNTADRKLLDQWCNPAKPPTAQLYKQWKNLLKNAAQQSTDSHKKNWLELGIEMAKLQSSNSPDTENALRELYETIGLNETSIPDSLYSKSQRQQFEEEETSSFSVPKMKSILDDEYEELRDQMRTLLSDPVLHADPEAIRTKADYREKVLEWCQLLADQGLGALSYPHANGGKDDMGSYATVFEMLGYHDLSLTVKFGVQFGLFGGSVLFLGTEKHHKKYLTDTGSLKLAGCFAMTETNHGSNVRELQTTATYDPSTDEIIIHTPTEHDSKEYIGNALHSKIASVFAQLIVNGEQHGVHTILVPLRNEKHQLLEGIRVEDNGYKLGLNGVDNGKIWFNQVRVPRANLLDRYGAISDQGVYTSPIENAGKRFFTMLGTLVGGRVCVPRAGLSAAKTALTIAIKYATQRRQFAPSPNEKETLLLDYPTHQMRLIPRLAKAYALDFALSYLGKRFANRSEADIREIETLAAGLKSYATWFTSDTIQECREACGGKGYLHENRFADLKADADIFTTFEGDNTVLLQLVAKGLLSDFKKEFHDEGYRAVLRYISSQMGDTITSYNPVFKRNTERSHLLDAEFHLDAFRYRERQLLYEVSNSIRDYIKKQFPAYEAFLKVQNEIIALALAYVERIVLEQFLEGLKTVKDDPCQKILTKLFQLYALSTIHEHRGWYLENDYMNGSKSKAIRQQIYNLCGDIRPHVKDLVNAFAIPDALLKAPIAMSM